MKTKADRLIHQIQAAQHIAQRILDLSGLTHEGIVYAFATPTTLVINCRTDEATWRFDDAQIRLWEAIDQVSASIQRVLVEKQGRVFFEF